MSAPLLLFAHGAGAPSSHPWMQAWAQRLEAIGRVHTFDYDYIGRGRGPDRLPKLVEQHRAALAAARAGHVGRVILIGKSMGSRVGCHVALEEPIDALVCLGYPLVGAGKRRPMRDAVLRDLRTPVLFVQGTRDRLCPLEALEAVRDDMTAPSALHVVETGDHSLLVTKTFSKQTGRSQEDVDREILSAIASFVGSR